MPIKTKYIQNESLDLNGIVVTAIYNNGTEANVAPDCTYVPANGAILSELGAQTIDVSYEENGVTKTTSFSVDVAIFGINEIRVTRTGSIAYRQGETLDISRITVKAFYSDGTEEIITNECTYTPTNLQDAGRIPISVSYTYPVTGDVFTTTYEVWVGEFRHIQVNTRPKTVYQQGEALDLTGIEISAWYSYDGGYSSWAEDVTEHCTFSPPDGTVLTTVGYYDVYISYTEYGKTSTIPMQFIVR
jgi:hypothetical protein